MRRWLQGTTVAARRRKRDYQITGIPKEKKNILEQKKKAKIISFNAKNIFRHNET